MSEMAAVVPDDLRMDSQAIRPSVATTGPGALLRSAREAQGLQIAALAVTLKIPEKKLEALESDRYDLLHDMVFVRALALSVCRVLKVDAGAVMAALPQLQAPAIKTDAAGLNASFKSSESSLRIASLVRAVNPAAFVMLALVLAIVVIFLWPVAPAGDGIVQEAGTAAQGTAVTADRPLEAVASLPKDTVSQVVSIQTAVRSALLSTSTPVMVSGASASVAANTVAQVSSSVVATSVESVLMLQVRDASWIAVTDARGNSQLRKMASAGEVLQVTGVLPLSVVLGRADAVKVTVRGKPLDVTAISKDNVARFEVK